MQTNVRDTSLKALKDNKIYLGADQQEVFEAICTLGPCDDARILEFLEQRELAKPPDRRHHWRNSDIPARRNQLVRKKLLGEGLVIDRGAYFGRVLIRNKYVIRQHHFWSVWNDARPVPENWHQRIEDVEGYKAAMVRHGSPQAKQLATTLF